MATGTVALVPYALPMNTEDRVPITLHCFKCLAEREILIPRERGVTTGEYIWECLECQRKRIDWSGNETLEGEDFIGFPGPWNSLETPGGILH